MHPMKREAEDAINAKMRKMTEHYGSASGPENNKLAPPNRDKMEGPEPSIGFGADSGAPRGRGDRPGRKPTITNPIPTYAKGGAVARAMGGRTKKGKGATNVNVIVAPQGGGAPAMPPPMPPVIAGPPPGTPPMPPKPPMGAGPMGGMPPGAAGLPMAPGAPGGMPPGLIPPRKRGGRVHADEAQDRALFKKMEKEEGAKERAKGGRVSDDEPQGDAVTERTLRNEGLVRERAAGGRMPHMTAGAATGVGRLEKIGEKPKNAGRPQAV